MSDPLHFLSAGTIVAQLWLCGRKQRLSMLTITAAAITAAWIYNGLEIDSLLPVAMLLGLVALFSVIIGEIEHWLSRAWPTE